MNIESTNNDTRSDDSDNLEILFLDTFTCQSIEETLDDVNKKELNVGLVQFSLPVIIHEVRIIPLSTLVSATNLKGVRLGATIPSAFEIHFFVNDLKAKESTTFLDIGRFDYNEHASTIFKPVLHVATDGLYLQGYFESVTLAVLGVVTDLTSLLSKEQAPPKVPSDTINELDESSTNHGHRDTIEEIKEPDEEDECIKEPMLSGDNFASLNDTVVTKSSNESHVVIKEDVHSLSPSPEPVITRIQSPSPHYHFSTPKSNSSNSSRDVRSQRSTKEFEYSKSKFSRSRSRSPSSNQYSLKSRINYPSPREKSHHSERASRGAECEDGIRSGSSSQPHRNSHDRYRSSHRSRDRSPNSSSRSSSRHYSHSNSTRHGKRSRSRESYRSNHQASSSGLEVSRRRRSSRSTSADRNTDTRSVHSRDSRDDRSISSLSINRSRNSATYELSDNNHDHSSRSSKHSHHHSHVLRYHSDRTRDRRSRSHSSDRKRTRHRSPSNEIYYHREPVKPTPNTLILVPQLKRADFTPLLTISPTPYASSLNAISSKVEEPSKVIESIASPLFQQNDGPSPGTTRNDIQTTGAVSPHSSISNVSLKSLENVENECNNKSDKVNHQTEISNHEEELFEPLSPSGDDLLGDDHFEQISLSSDVDFDEVMKDSKGELLESISSDEEYPDELNAALSSDKIDYAKSYLDSTGSNKYDDDEIDNAFDTTRSLFDPFALNQLTTLKFPFHNNTTTFIDAKLFNSIMKFVEEHFCPLYSQVDDLSTRREQIETNWVISVEQLAADIMKLSSPICCSFSSGQDQRNTSEQDLERLATILVAIAKDGLDFELALTQKEAPFKVRHLKAGIKLLIALMSSFDLRTSQSNRILFQRLFDSDLPYDLLKLYNKPYMALSLRLLILNALIIICDYPEGVDYLCERRFSWSEENDEIQFEIPSDMYLEMTCYQYLLTVMMKPQNTRLTSVFEELLDKIHLYEMFAGLSQMSRDNNLSDLCSSGSPELNSLGVILKQLVTYFTRLSNRIHRPLRLLPNVCQYEIKTAVHSSVPMLLLSTTSLAEEFYFNQNKKNANFYNFIQSRLSCKHISCSSSKTGFFSQKAFYRYFKHFNAFALILNILKMAGQFEQLSSEVVSMIETVITLLGLISSHQQGLRFLLEDEQNVTQANNIHNFLVKLPKERKCSKKLIQFGTHFITRLYSFGLVDLILFNLYQSQMNLGQDYGPVIDSLLRLFLMAYMEKSLFRESVVSILSLEHNFDVIISFLIPITSGFDSTSNWANQRFSYFDSISFIYATKLASACIQYLPEKNLIHFYDTYGQLLLKNIENVQSLVQNSSVKLHKSDIFQNHVLKFASLIQWLAPLKSGNFNTHDELTIRKFVTLLKRHSDLCFDKFSSIDNYVYRVFCLEPELVTAIKLLVSLCDPNSDYAKNQDPDIQLKYKYSLINCYSFDSMSYLMTLLEAVAETCLRPSHQAYPFTFSDYYTAMYLKSFQKSPTASVTDMPQSKQHSIQQYLYSILHQGPLVIEFLRPAVRLLKLILQYILNSMGHRFNDSTPTPVLLKLYNFLDQFHNASIAKDVRFSEQLELSTVTLARAVQTEIISILQSIYTAVYVEHSESEEKLRKSVWTKMLRHLLEFIMSSSKFFVSGLDIFSRTMPPPLPLVVDKPAIESEMDYQINYRKLWAAHLHVVSGDIEEMLKFFVLSDSHQVQTLLRTVCYQLCDLSSSTVITLTRTITEFLVHNLSNAFKYKTDPPATTIDRELPTTSATVPDLYTSKSYLVNCVKILDFTLDLFSSSLSFRIGILNAFHCFANSDVARKDSVRIYEFFFKMFIILNQKRFDSNIEISSVSLLKNILLDSSESVNKTLFEMVNRYFDGNINIASLGQFKFSDKLTSKFVASCSSSLFLYFSKRKIFCNTASNSDSSDQKEEEELRPNENSSVAPTLCEDTGTELEKIYGEEFIELSAKLHLPSTWFSLEQQSELESETVCKVDFVELSKKYFNMDLDELKATLQSLYSPIVEQPEPAEKPVEEPARPMHLLTPAPKRNMMRSRRTYGHRLNDPFRSRPPNTSRPPSMHVDDFVALEQRQDPLAGLPSKGARSNHLHVVSGASHSNASPFGNKHSDYVRKKTLHPVHSHTLYPRVNNLNSSGSNSSLHYKQS